jgi:hypothetical protein
MSVIQAIKQIIKADAILADGTQHTHAIIEEKNEAKLKKLTLSELQTSHLVIGLDDARKLSCDSRIACMSPIFSTTSTYDHNRACDALLIDEKENGKCKVTYIELKSDSPSGFEGQFKSASCFMVYIKEILDKLCCVKMEIIKENFVVFHTDSNNGRLSLHKTTTRKHEPKNPRKIIVKNGDTKRVTEF